jgi:hypothetical protein
LSSPNAAHGDGGTLIVWVEEYPYSNFEQKLVVGAFVTPQPEVQDWWWNPAMDGMGWTVGKQGNSVVVSWYHYWTTTGPTFLLFHGPLVNNVVQGTLWRSYATPPPPPNYDPALLSNEAVGSARLSFLSDSQAIFEYSYDDRSGSITLQRFNFDDINLSGSWRYFASGIQSECKFPVNDGPYVANGDLTISQVGKTITIAQAFDAGGTCTYRLNATQNGSYTDAEGSYACSFGVSGLAEFRDMHIVDDILTLRYASEVSSGEACEHKSKLIGFQ